MVSNFSDMTSTAILLSFYKLNYHYCQKPGEEYKEKYKKKYNSKLCKDSEDCDSIL